MKALVYHGPNEKSWDEVPDSTLIDDTDAVVRVDATTICGSDLHILKGDLPEVTPGRVLGHEAVGTVEAVGAAVRNVTSGDRVLVSCISACGQCRFCRQSRFGQCLGGGGWILGHNIDGTQAEKVRVPFADTSTYPVPAGVSDEEFLMLADILPTAYEVGVLNGGVSPGDVVAVVGAGPIGLSAITGSLLFSPSHVVAIDLADTRLDAAKQFGADVIVNNGREDPLAIVQDLTAASARMWPSKRWACRRRSSSPPRSSDRAGMWPISVSTVSRPHCTSRTLWTRDVTITTGLVDTYSTPTLSRLVATRQLDAARFATHHFTLDQMMEAYDVFSNASESGALKVVLSRAR